MERPFVRGLSYAPALEWSWVGTMSLGLIILNKLQRKDLRIWLNLLLLMSWVSFLIGYFQESSLWLVICMDRGLWLVIFLNLLWLVNFQVCMVWLVNFQICMVWLISFTDSELWLVLNWLWLVNDWDCLKPDWAAFKMAWCDWLFIKATCHNWLELRTVLNWMLRIVIQLVIVIG